MLDAIYLWARRLARRIGVPITVYRWTGSYLRRVLGLSDTLVADRREQADGRVVAALLVPFHQEAGQASKREPLEKVLGELGGPETFRLLVRSLWSFESRAALEFAYFLCDQPEVELRQAAHLLLAIRSAFWRDFRGAEKFAEVYLDEADQGSDGRQQALAVLAQAKRRLGKLDEALLINRQQSLLQPLNTRFLAERARLLATENQREMLRLLELCDAPGARAEELGNTLYLSYLLERKEFDEAERLARRLETRVPGCPVGRVFLSNALTARDGDVSALPTAFECFGIDCTISAPSFDALRIANRQKSLKDVKDGPLVSVVLTAYNVERYVELAVASILSQSYLNLELIVVDDNSTDSTLERLREIQTRDDRVRIIKNEKNSGTYLAKNAGIQNSEGDLIALCDSDDIWTPNHLERHLEEMATDGGLMVTTSDWLRLFDHAQIEVSPNGAIVEVCPHSTLIRREVFNRIGYFDSVRFGADREFISRIILSYGKPSVCHIAEVLTIGRRHGASLTSSGPGKIIRDQISGVRIDYWEAWNEWQKEKVLKREALINTGIPKERPYHVPIEMEP
ncbi:glycosyltransferase family A protein [Histidinibacterium aquaticum]|uniref:Glycosyltransferase family 2 protein n=1 Tax=Histidinibacterium aquaticum TaxID=2613962 RepID=A0A5J5GAD7_9RHOB|nr:glycosyltransferase family A protein [Histidinibacterium aquaticum]KAA9005099.1 glycosyltransferase family 2 protein [Histidinibacterium aquaticum]